MRAIIGMTSGELQNPEIANRMRDLRSSLGMSQPQLAKVLGVSLTKVHTWEKGAQVRPPAEILLMMSRLAQAKELRHWFIQEAGVELEILRTDFHEEIMMQGTGISQEALVTLPLFNAFRVKGNGSIAPRQFDAEQFQISSHLIRHPQSAVGVVVGAEAASLCRSLPLNSGDLLIVDRSRRHASGFLAGRESATQEMVAIIFPQLDLSMKYRSEIAFSRDGTLQSEMSNHSVSANEGNDDMSNDSPKVLFGHLCEQFAGVDVDEILPGRQFSRILFSVGHSKGIPFTDWQAIGEERNVDARPFSHRASILGAVTGWIKMPRELPGI